MYGSRFLVPCRESPFVDGFTWIVYGSRFVVPCRESPFMDGGWLTVVGFRLTVFSSKYLVYG